MTQMTFIEKIFGKYQNLHSIIATQLIDQWKRKQKNFLTFDNRSSFMFFDVRSVDSMCFTSVDQLIISYYL